MIVSFRRLFAGDKRHLFIFYLHTDFYENFGESVSTELEIRLGPGNENGFKDKDRQLFKRNDDTGSEDFFANNQFDVLKNCLQDGDLHVEFHVKILEMTGFEREKKKRFGEEMKRFSDVALVVKEEKFYISKLYLSSQSPYFDTLFNGPFQESGKTEIELKDIEPNHLQYYLEVLHLAAHVDDIIVEGVLYIAHMYDTPSVATRCEEFLLEKSMKSLKQKLDLSVMYSLDELKKNCMDQVETVADSSSVTPSPKNPKK